MNDILRPAFHGRQVRIVTIDGEPWFVAADVAAILGYRDAERLTRRIDPEDKGPHIVGTPGGDQWMVVINEAGLYAGVLGSTVERAKDFKRWVTREVLPAIRKTGSYGAAPALTEDQIVHQALQITARKVEELEARNAELEPKADAFDGYIGADGDYSINATAKLLQRRGVDTGQNRLANQLLDWGWLYRGEKRRLRVKQAQIDTGRLDEKTYYYIDDRTGERKAGSSQPRVTPKGIEDIYQRLTAGTTLEEAS